MQQTRSRVVELPKGHGTVSQNGVTVARVRYSLQVVQQYATSVDHDGSREIELSRSASGTVWSEDGADLFGKNDLMLYLSDGRSVHVLITSKRLGSPAYPVVHPVVCSGPILPAPSQAD